jgi:hypothetical protein
VNALERFYLTRESSSITIVVLVATWFVVSFVLLVACGRAQLGTVTQVNRLPTGNYQLEVIARYTGDGLRDVSYALHDVGPSTGCEVGEVWPACD